MERFSAVVLFGCNPELGRSLELYHFEIFHKLVLILHFIVSMCGVLVFLLEGEGNCGMCGMSNLMKRGCNVTATGKSYYKVV